MMRKLMRFAAIVFFVLTLPLMWLALVWLPAWHATMAWLWDGMPWRAMYRETLERIVDAF